MLHSSKKLNTLLPATMRKIENVPNILYDIKVDLLARAKEISLQDIENATYLPLAMPIRYRYSLKGNGSVFKKTESNIKDPGLATFQNKIISHSQIFQIADPQNV